jgi:nitroimidazol reductase NimA-like FMN-containing flavoprotein (pyridoxamine 5'-phosphate oxidase superfamily)
MMRRKDKEITDMVVIESILQEADVCRLAMVDGQVPYMVPMSFGYQNRILYFHSAPEGRKLNILKKNNLVCFEAESNVKVFRGENPCNWTMKYFSVIGSGRAEITEDLAEKELALNLIMEKYNGPGEYRYPVEALEKIVIIKVVVDEISGKKSKY